MACTFSAEFEAKSDAQKIWDFVKNFHIICPRAFPQLYDSVEVVEGDGNSTGTVRTVKYVPGIPVTNIKERLDLVDDENKTISCTFLEGDIFEIYKSFKATLVLNPKGDGTIMKFYGEFERATGAEAFAHDVQDFINLTFGILDKYLVSKSERVVDTLSFGLSYISIYYMAGHDVGGAGPIDDRIHIHVQDSIFMPDHNRVIRFITSRFLLQTCDEGHSWKYVTEAQREWYWDEFVKFYRWDEEISSEIRHVWYTNIATLYRRTIHGWRSSGRYPTTVPAARWASWTDAWNSEGWKDRAGKNKVNRGSEPGGAGTGTCKHIAGSKTYSAHYHSMKAAQPGTDPSTWDLFLRTHRRGDGTFVDDRSRSVHHSMEAYMDESLTPLDDGTIPDQPSSEEVNNMFQHVVGGKKKGRMYGCGSMATSLYPHEMAPRPRGGRSGGISSQESTRLREDFEQQSREVEYLRVDLQASQRRGDDLERSNEELRQRMEEQGGRIDSMEETIRRLAAGLPPVPPTHPDSQTYSRAQYSGGFPIRGRSTADRFMSSSSRTLPRGKVLQIPGKDSSTSSQPNRFTQQRHDDDTSSDDDKTQP